MIVKINNNINAANIRYNKIKYNKQQNQEFKQNLNKTQFVHDTYTGNISAPGITFKSLTVADTALVEKARNFAKEKHINQLYGQGPIKYPYTYHTEGVAKLVSEYTDNPEVIAAAHLHDTLEDTDTTYVELCLIFGKKVAGYVLAVTTDKTEKERLGKAKALVNEVKSIDEDSLLIKLCDRKFNVDNLSDADTDFRRKYALETHYLMTRLLEERRNIPAQCRRIIMNILGTLEKIRF